MMATTLNLHILYVAIVRIVTGSSTSQFTLNLMSTQTRANNSGHVHKVTVHVYMFIIQWYSTTSFSQKIIITE